MSLLAAIPFLAPLILAPHLLFYYDITPKVALLLLGAAVALALASKELDSLAAFCGTGRGRWYAASAAAWLALVCLATLDSAHRELAWNGSNWRRMGALTWCALVPAALWTAAYASRSPARLVFLLRAVCTAGLIASLYGIAQYFGWDPLLPAAAYHAGQGVFEIVRPPGTLGHSDYFAAFLLWPVFAGIGLSRSATVLGRVAAIAGSIAILLSGSRGALLALIAGLCLLAFFLRPSLRGAAGIMAVAVAALAIFFISPAGQRLRARVHWIGEDRLGGSRLLLWRDSLKMSAHRPFAGFGPDNFVAEFPHYQSEDLERAYPDFLQESPHNILLDALTEDGVLGMLALVAVAAAGTAGSFTVARVPGPRMILAAALLSGFIATLIAHQFVVFTAPTAFYFFLGAGVLAGFDAGGAGAPVVGRAWRRIALATGLIGAALFGFAAYRMVAADARLASVRRRLDANDPRGAAEAYREALSRTNAGVTADLYFSRRWAAVAANARGTESKLYYSQIAAGAASLATRSPEQQQNAWYNLSVLIAPGNDLGAVESALLSAIAASPTWYKPHWSLARLRAFQGRREEAGQEARQALYLNNGKDPEVKATLAKVLGSRSESP